MPLDVRCRISVVELLDCLDLYRYLYGWAIIQRGTCLNKEGKWEFEPMPSSRTEEFFERTRFKDEQEAFEFFEKVVKEDVDSI